eukprot:CAMPEP_0119323846 /NCGR_PEP_ID=MMETSP1333-20130426/61770_1 /TAXON_ID=418940 /ORGANISM="Scyphosphaera apsteinii, Strain RCC1455" /LENGTH=63 /DNA_ID=CAMNT_0007331405 /DNA_START=99 /DNA_END=287 /DNA_ORIENTATION=-
MRLGLAPQVRTTCDVLHIVGCPITICVEAVHCRDDGGGVLGGGPGGGGGPRDSLGIGLGGNLG